MFVTLSMIHNPIHRHLINDTEEQRVWCTTSYSSIVKVYDYVILLLHFLIPFLINIISAFIIIITIARKRWVVRKNETYKEQLYTQFHQHKSPIISPHILVLLALPRLILSFLSGCMKSARDPWRYLVAYFVSFIPCTYFYCIYFTIETIQERIC